MKYDTRKFCEPVLAALERIFPIKNKISSRKSTGRPRLSEKSVARVRYSFLCNLKKSVLRTSRELVMPVTTVGKVLRKRLELRPYRLQLLQALKPTGYGLHAKFTKHR
ncbi:hypothetical protein TNCV_2073521 [Trichonephila clavipes]|uniref:Uncharacterized protein n=1 Tax=Trichonephila clavipes TaxID=2585209 RepID=A0A8X6RE22_TRICX|nr:hypothetical protein TNCV_2073521 [Trichonephila clavipes]